MYRDPPLSRQHLSRDNFGIIAGVAFYQGKGDLTKPQVLILLLFFPQCLKNVAHSPSFHINFPQFGEII
jgi:hypothetical protein